MIQIYTGNGKGKTTAALGLALRAAGAGKKVRIIQFMKNSKTSEIKLINKRLPQIKASCFGSNCLVTKDNVSEKDFKQAENGLKAAKAAFKGKMFDVVILDELNVALHFKLVKINDALDLINKKPKNIELVITGRYAPKELIRIADLVTEMEEKKHYFSKGVKARKGIEY